MVTKIHIKCAKAFSIAFNRPKHYKLWISDKSRLKNGLRLQAFQHWWSGRQDRPEPAADNAGQGSVCGGLHDITGDLDDVGSLQRVQAVLELVLKWTSKWTSWSKLRVKWKPQKTPFDSSVPSCILSTF